MPRGLPQFSTVAIAVSTIIIGVAAFRADILSGLVTVAVLVIGLYGSYVLGRESRNAPPVRQSYRHLARIQANLYALTDRLAADRLELRSYEHVPGEGLRRAADLLSMAEFSIGQTFGYVGEAMEDWADLAPSEVAEFRRELVAAPPTPAAVEALDTVDDGWRTIGEWEEVVEEDGDGEP